MPSGKKLPGVSERVSRQTARLEDGDVAENLAFVVRNFNEEIDIGEASSTLDALLCIDWKKQPPEDRATMIDYCVRVLGGISLKVAEG